MTRLSYGASPLPSALLPEQTTGTARPSRFLGSITADLQELPADRGQPVLTAADQRAVYQARLQDALDVLVDARWAPEGDGNLNALLDAADRRALARVLKGPDRAVIALRRGKAALTPEQAERLAPVVDQSFFPWYNDC